MELLLLGTAASEGWPAAHCDCPACQEARRRGGPNLRSRTGALIDNDLKIDFNGDTMMQMQRVRRSLSGMRTILFTHQHLDHLHPQSLRYLTHPFTATPPAEPIAVYGNEHVLAAIRSVCPDPRQWHLDLRLMRPLEPFATDSGDQVLPLPAVHLEGTLLLRITRGGRTLFYGHDSGMFPRATFDALAEGPPLDIALLECTAGELKTSNREHLDADGVLQTVGELRRRGVIIDTTRTIVTHFSHGGRLLHEELVALFAPHAIEVAFDGMLIPRVSPAPFAEDRS